MLGLSMLFGSSGGSSKSSSSDDDDDDNIVFSMAKGATDAIFGNERSSGDGSYNAGYDVWSDD